MVELLPEQYEMFKEWQTLNKDQKEAIQHLISVMKKPR